MKIKILIILLQILLFSIPMLSQENIKMDEVYLNDGSFVRGEIIEKVEGQYIRMKISGDNTVQFSMSEIKKIKRQHKNFHYFSNGSKVKTNGIYFNILGGMVFGKNNYDRTFGKSFEITSGYKVNKYFGLGGGIGFDNYEPEVFSFFAEARFYPLRKKIMPYLSGKIGQGVPVNLFNDNNLDQYSNGLFLSPKIGLQFSSRSNTSIIFEVGYKFQRTKRSFEWQQTKDKITYRRLSTTIGFQF